VGGLVWAASLGLFVYLRAPQGRSGEASSVGEDADLDDLVLLIVTN